jgi:hypothetical protein
VLEILSTQTVPVPGAPVGTMTYRIGSALSYVLGASGATIPVGLGGSVNAAGGDASAAQPAAEPGASGPSSGSGASGLGGVSQPQASGVGASAGAATPTLSGNPITNTARRASPASFARDLRSTTRWFYAVLAIGGAALLFAMALWRKKGVQASWLS